MISYERCQTSSLPLQLLPPLSDWRGPEENTSAHCTVWNPLIHIIDRGWKVARKGTKDNDQVVNVGYGLIALIVRSLATAFLSVSWWVLLSLLHQLLQFSVIIQASERHCPCTSPLSNKLECNTSNALNSSNSSELTGDSSTRRKEA